MRADENEAAAAERRDQIAALERQQRLRRIRVTSRIS